MDKTESNLKDTDESELVGSWFLDEIKAFRQACTLAVTQTGGFFVMIGHSFRLTASVKNYDRRAVALTHIIQEFFQIPTLSCTRFGMARQSLLKLDSDLISELCHLLGVQLNSKSQMGPW